MAPPLAFEFIYEKKKWFVHVYVRVNDRPAGDFYLYHEEWDAFVVSLSSGTMPNMTVTFTKG